MPICDDPNAFGYYTLRGDRNKPLPKRPRFRVKFLKRSEARAIERMLEDAGKPTTTDDACYQLLGDAIRATVVGTENFTTDLSQESLEALLTNAELGELANGWRSATLPAEEDRKNSESPVS